MLCRNVMYERVYIHIYVFQILLANFHKNENVTGVQNYHFTKTDITAFQS